MELLPHLKQRLVQFQRLELVEFGVQLLLVELRRHADGLRQRVVHGAHVVRVLVDFVHHLQREVQG